MSEQVDSITWEAYEHHYVRKTNDWFWILGILTIIFTTISILMNNMLFGILIFIAGLVIALHATVLPKVIPFAVTKRGLRVDDKLYPYSTLESFCIDEDCSTGPQLLVQSEKLFMTLIVVPIPEEYLDEIEDILASRLPEEHLEEPFVTKLLDYLGF